MKKEFRNGKMHDMIDIRERKRVQRKLEEFQTSLNFDNTPDEEKQIKELRSLIDSRFHYIWFEGLPDFARICVWPMLLENLSSLTPAVYIHFKG